MVGTSPGSLWTSPVLRRQGQPRMQSRSLPSCSRTSPRRRVRPHGRRLQPPRRRASLRGPLVVRVYCSNFAVRPLRHLEIHRIRERQRILLVGLPFAFFMLCSVVFHRLLNMIHSDFVPIALFFSTSLLLGMLSSIFSVCRWLCSFP